MEEKVYTINIRRGILDKPRWNRSKHAVSYVREYLKKHMKVDYVKIDNAISEKIWARSITKPLNKIRVKAIKDDEGIVKAVLWEETKENKE